MIAGIRLVTVHLFSLEKEHACAFEDMDHVHQTLGYVIYVKILFLIVLDINLDVRRIVVRVELL